MKKIQALAFSALLALGGSASAANHLYTFNGTMADALGGADMVGAGGTLGSTSYSFGKNEGLSLGEQLGSVYTIDMVMSFDTHSGWQKLIDFKDRTVDTGLYTSNTQWYFYNVGSMGNVPADGQSARVTLTRDSSKLVSLYVNGTLAGSFVDSANIAAFEGKGAHFFMDDTTNTKPEAAAGNVDYIATFDRALTAGEVAAGVSPVPEPASGAMLAAGLGMLAMLRRRSRKA
ncbi:PEP-CTERM sorting domain-containing protein [Pseudoduganella sp. FT93W]|uniref:PEP-CTERM sorting domain-containing protein n=1 Tax=Duganella fentianensis TaxID=2692177 RepID=A0A845HTA7_9BURK|nr:LamG-like jellyroll fold domain-containing protein [Duganella fentianensis]MYN44674.1 PEP-CTERM sorting domain-containing protein [Duganella fentianensis]